MSVSRACGSRQPSTRPNFACHAAVPGVSLPTSFLSQRGPADLGGVRALARGRDHAPVDEEQVAVGVEAELRLHPGAAPGRHVLVPDRGRLHDVAVAVEHREVFVSSWPRRSLLAPQCRDSGLLSGASDVKMPGIERFSLAGRVVLVTGATRGLGLEIARGMAAAGATVGINGRDAGAAPSGSRRHSQRLCRALRHHRPSRGGAAAIDAVVARHGRLDCLVNNAALRDRRPLHGDRGRRLPPPARDQSGRRVRAARASSPGTWRPRGRGGSSSSASMVGPQSFQGDPAYVASKGGLEALMRALAVELGPKGIAANAIAPGFFLTDVNVAVLRPAARRRAGAAHPAAALRPARRAGRRRHLPGVRRRLLRHGPGADRGRRALDRALVASSG